MNGFVPSGRLTWPIRWNRRNVVPIASSPKQQARGRHTTLITAVWLVMSLSLFGVGTQSAIAQQLIFSDSPTFSEMVEESKRPTFFKQPDSRPSDDWSKSPKGLLNPSPASSQQAQIQKPSFPRDVTPRKSVAEVIDEIRNSASLSKPLDEPPQSGKGGTVWRFPDKNIEFTDPGGSWDRLTKNDIENQKIVLALGSKLDTTFFIVSAEEVGTELRFKPSDLVMETKTRIQAAMRDATIADERPYRAAGIDGHFIEATGTYNTDPGKAPTCTLNWVGLHKGMYYRATFSGPQHQRDELTETFGDFLGRIQLIDPNRIIEKSSIYPGVIGVERWGMKLTCEGTTWIPQKDLMKDYGENTLIATQISPNGFLQTKAYSLFGKRMPQDAAVTAALLSFGIKLEEVRLSAQAVTVGKHKGVKVRVNLQTGNAADALVIVSNDTVWVTLVSLPTEDRMRQQRVDEIIHRLEFMTPTDAIKLDDLAAKEGDRHVTFFMAIASHCMKLKQVEQAREFVHMAVKLKPGSQELAEAGIDMMVTARDLTGALSIFRSAPRELFLDPSRQAQFAWILGLEGQTEEAIKQYGRVFPSKTADDSFLENYLSLLVKADQVDKALSVIEAVLIDRPTVRLYMAQSSLLGIAGRHDEAIEVLKKQRDAAPLAIPELNFALAEALLEGNRVEESLVEVQSLIDSGLDGSQTMILKGVAELRLERLAESRRTFETILAKDKTNPTAQKLLEIVAAKLGQGDFLEVRDRIEPVPLPASLANFTAKQPPLREGDGAWTALSARSIHFQAGKEFRATVTSVIHILDRHGVEAHNNLKFLFSPLSEQVFVNRVEVFDERGQLTGAVKLEDCYVQTNHDNGLATSKKVLNVPVPGLHPGCRLEYQVTYRDRGAPKRFPFTQHDSSKLTPTARSVLYVTGDVAAVQWSGPNPIKTASGLVWDNTQPGRIVPEVYLDDTQVSPTLVSIGDRQINWESESRDYLNELKSRLVIDQQMTQIVAQRLNDKPKATAEQKINLLAAWVQQQITYQGIEFGRRGQIMPPVDQTLRNRFGDCKEHSLLLVQLLRSAGINAHLALADTNSPVVTTVPSMDQFDHMVVYAEDERGPRVIDCTDKASDLALRVPVSLAMSQVLVLDANKPRFYQIPEVPNEHSRLYMDRTIQVDESGTAIVTEKLSAYEYAAMPYRHALMDARPESRREIIQAVLLPRGSNATLIETQIDNLNDHSKQLIIRAKYSLRDQLHNFNGQLIGRLPCYFETNMFDLNSNGSTDRIAPFRLRSQRDVTVRTRVTLQPGFEMTPLPANISKVERFAELVRITSEKDGVIEIRSRVRRPPGRFEPSDWKTLNEAQAKARDLFNPKAQISRRILQQVNGDKANPQ